MDLLQIYEDQLKKPQPGVLPGQRTGPAQVLSVGRRTLGGREWVESLHEGSELAGYNTYYMATVTSNIGILMTLSVQEGRQQQFIQEFNEMMGSLKTYQR